MRHALRIPKAAVVTSRRRGGPTFSPRGRNKVRWNQAPDVGLLGRKGIALVRAACAAKRGDKSRTGAPGEAKKEVLCGAFINPLSHTVLCPYCRAENHSRRPRKMRCWSCEREFVVMR